MQLHYVHTEEGAKEILNLRSRKEVQVLKEEALKHGYQPSKIIVGTEYFDCNQLMMLGPCPLAYKIPDVITSSTTLFDFI